MSRRTLRLSVVALAFPLVLTACGGGGGNAGRTVSPTDYVGAVCSHVKSWIGDIRQGFQQLQQAAQPGTAPEKGKELLSSFFDRTVSDTDSMISGIGEAGVPDVPNGRSLASSFLSALERAKAALETARKGVDSLPTSSGAAFQQAADSLGKQVQSNMGQVGTAIGSLHSTELEQAAKKTPACRGIA
jgi:hypothetical protein